VRREISIRKKRGSKKEEHSSPFEKEKKRVINPQEGRKKMAEKKRFLCPLREKILSHPRDGKKKGRGHLEERAVVRLRRRGGEKGTRLFLSWEKNEESQREESRVCGAKDGRGEKSIPFPYRIKK